MSRKSYLFSLIQLQSNNYTIVLGEEQLIVIANEFVPSPCCVNSHEQNKWDFLRFHSSIIYAGMYADLNLKYGTNFKASESHKVIRDE